MTAPVLAGESTLVASWRALAVDSPGATVIERAGSVAAVFPAWSPLNNAIARVPIADRAATDAEVSRLAARYRDAGVPTWAYWVPSLAVDLDAPRARAVPGAAPDVSTLVMTAVLAAGRTSHPGAVATSIATAALAGDEPVPLARVEPPGPGSGMAAWVMVRDGFAVAGLWTCVHEGDCGVYAVGTAPAFRRRGDASALVEHALADARRAGARTASLQSTPDAVSLYQRLGFTAVGRYEEWVFDSGPSSS